MWVVEKIPWCLAFEDTNRKRSFVNGEKDLTYYFPGIRAQSKTTCGFLDKYERIIEAPLI